MTWRWTMSLAVLASCRFGGPSADPDAYVSLADGPVDGASGATGTGGDAAMVAPAGDSGLVPPDDAGVSGGDGGSFEDVAALCSPAVAVCDPVHNTGCNPLQQCDVNSLQTSMPTGLCVFGGTADSGTCSVSIVNESCAPGSTCLDGGCRQLCFCTADCPAGQCCSDRSTLSGFGLCRSCP